MHGHWWTWKVWQWYTIQSVGGGMGWHHRGPLVFWWFNFDRDG